MYLCTEAIAPSPARKSNEALLRAHAAAAAPACSRVLTCSHVTTALQVLVSTIMVWILFQKKPAKSRSVRVEIAERAVISSPI